mgnify:CR=1 FL=1
MDENYDLHLHTIVVKDDGSYVEKDNLFNGCSCEPLTITIEEDDE